MEKHEGVIDLTVWALGSDGKFRRNCLYTVTSAWICFFFRKGPCLEYDFLSLALGLELSVPVVDFYLSKPVRRGKEIHAPGNDP